MTNAEIPFIYSQASYSEDTIDFRFQSWFVGAGKVDISDEEKENK